jgi:hypothetical protein
MKSGSKQCGLGFLLWQLWINKWKDLTRPIQELCRTDACIQLGLPAPQTRTVSPIVRPARRHACTPTDNGSSNAPSSKLTESGNLEDYKH